MCADLCDRGRTAPHPVEAINHVPKMMYRAFTLLALQPHHARHRSTWLERRTHL
jgi:hypothetical protein